MAYVSFLKIIENLDINEGDRVFISSDIKRLMLSCHQNNELFDGQLFIDSMIQKIGPAGTLLFPTYSWEFCKGVTFDYYQTKSEAGTLTNMALKRKDFKRTKHPIYSFAVWGRDQEALCGLTNISSFGPDSAFPFFYENQYKNLFIDVEYQRSATFVHYCEEKIGVPYRFMKQFTAGYRDENGIASQRAYTMYVRPLDKIVQTTINPMQGIFLQQEAVKYYEINGIPYNLVSMPAAYGLVEHDIIHNRSRNIVIYEGQ